MHKFKIGDEVRRLHCGVPGMGLGETGIVVFCRDFVVRVQDVDWKHDPNYLELVEHVRGRRPDIMIEDDLAENSGGSCDYYKVDIWNPTTPELNSDNLPEDVTYTAECNDIIEALNMTYAEANMFKEIWRSAASRTLGKQKAGHDALRGAEKIVFFADRNMVNKKVASNG